MLEKCFTTFGLVIGLACAPSGDTGGLFATEGEGDGGDCGSAGDDGDGDGADDDGSAGDSTSAGEGADDDPGIKLDVNDDPGPIACDPDDEDCGCTAVDLLFIVDNSGSMNWLVPAFNDAFPIFVDEIFTVLPPATDLHVGIARSSGYFDPGNQSGADDPVTCVDPAGIDHPNVGTWNPPTLADTGINGQQGRLYEYAGQRYFEVKTDEDPAPLAAWFGPAFQTAIEQWTLPHSNTETTVAGSGYPFHPVNAAHNAGFMRQNAVLILYLISNHSDMTPDNIPTQDFIDMVHDAKAGCGGNACILTGGALPIDYCYGQPGNINTRFYDFLNGFGKPPASLVDISNYPMVPDFTGVLGAALAEVVATTCESVPPAG